MAGATNRAMKAAGLPKATQEKIRVARGAGLTVQSAIQHAQAHGLPLGKAAKHVGELSGWQKAAAGAKVEARPATKRAPGESLEAYRARDLTSRDPATMRAAIREQIKKIRSDAGGEADVQRQLKRDAEGGTPRLSPCGRGGSVRMGLEPYSQPDPSPSRRCSPRPWPWSSRS